MSFKAISKFENEQMSKWGGLNLLLRHEIDFQDA